MPISDAPNVTESTEYDNTDENMFTIDDEEVQRYVGREQYPNFEESSSRSNTPTMINFVNGIVSTKTHDVVHDQLPSVEEIKATQLPYMSGGQKCFRITGVLVALALIMVAVIVHRIIVAKDPYITPHKGHSSSQSSNGGSSRFTQVVDYLVEAGVASKSRLTTNTSPQYYAAMWIADSDAYNIPIPSNFDTAYNEFVERFVLAMLYIALDGPVWTYQSNFMKPTHVCSWFQDFRTTADGFLRMGVSACQGSSQGEASAFITQITLRKYTNI